MDVFRGNTATEASWILGGLPVIITNIMLSNRTGSAATVNLVAVKGAVSYNISPYDLSLAAKGSDGCFYQDIGGHLLLALDTIKITTSGDVSYYITFKNAEI